MRKKRTWVKYITTPITGYSNLTNYQLDAFFYLELR